MDPLTAIGLVSNILSFIDFSARLLKGAKEVHDSHHGVLEDNRNRETVMREMQRMSTRILVPRSPGKASDDSSLCILASECHQLSTQLISLLKKIKPDDSGSKAQSLLSAIRNKVYDSERESLEARLSDCRAQLHLELSNLTRTETLEKLESLVQASKTDEAKLDRIERHIAQLRENLSSTSPASEVTPMLRTLLAEEEKVFTTIAQDRILNCISYERMSQRSNMVVETHGNTYEWILENNSAAKQPARDDEGSVVEKESYLQAISEDIEKVRARDKLKEWLESKAAGDVFHLSGKLGSGKSTLMKHIRASPRTEEKLNKWADGRKLTIANFYFWNIGSEYEKSLQGLYVSLLYQIFSQCPDIIPQVWPAQWAQASSAPWLVPRVIEVTKTDIMQAFERVIKSDDALKNHCFALFIDGLDEFQTTVQSDHRDLVRLLCRWAASESGNIKICVSSREYPVFMDGFTPTLRIRFHDLTRRDMDTYIRDKLAHASTEESFEDLVSLIMNKADGVFLWVALVVKSLREGLENGLSCSDLTREVDILPEQLESLYRHILASLGNSALKKAYQTFSMVAELKKQNYRMSLLAYSFFEEYEVGKGFFMKEHNLFPMDSLIGRHGKERAKSTSRKLAGWCKGLVELYDRQETYDGGLPDDGPCVEAWGDLSMELDFAHRSIADFLESDEVQRETQLNLTRFEPVDVVLNLIVSDILFESSTSFYNTSRSGVTSAVYMRMIDQHGLDREPFTNWKRLRELLASAGPSDSLNWSSLMLMTFGREEGRFGSAYRLQFAGNRPAASEEEKHLSPPRRRYFSDPLLILTSLGLSDYPLWHINNNSGLSERPDTVSCLACLCLDEGFGKRDRMYQPINVLEALFARHWISPDSIINYRVEGHRRIWSEDSEDRPDLQNDLTLWQRFLVQMLGARYHRVSKLMTPDEYEYHQGRQHYDGKLLELFLRYQQDAEFSFEIRVDEKTTVSRRDFLLKFGNQGSILKLRTARYETKREDTFHFPWRESEVGLPSEDGKPARRWFSLRKFIELSQYNNKAELLKLLAKDSRPVEGDQPRIWPSTDPCIREWGHTGDQIQRGGDGEETTNTDGNLEFELTNRLKLQHSLEIVSLWVRCFMRNEYVRYAVAMLTGDNVLTDRETGVILTTLFTSVRERLDRTPPA